MPDNQKPTTYFGIDGKIPYFIQATIYGILYIGGFALATPWFGKFFNWYFEWIANV